MEFKKKIAGLMAIFLSLSALNAQYEIKPEEGYSPNIGIMVAMLEEIRHSITEDIGDLNPSETDYLFDDKANSIGALLLHMIATEAYYQVETLDGRAWTAEEGEFWGIAAGLEAARDKVKGKPITYYLNLWGEVRQRTLAGLKTKDDAWFAAHSFEEMNNHWAWFHILEHSASHMGQIALVKNRLPARD